MNITEGQKLYHFAYGPMTVTEVNMSKNGNIIRTTVDDPAGYRRKEDCPLQTTQMWILETVGHWLFESADEVGSENNDFDWKQFWPEYAHAPEEPVTSAKDRDNWHEFYKAG